LPFDRRFPPCYTAPFAFPQKSYCNRICRHRLPNGDVHVFCCHKPPQVTFTQLFCAWHNQPAQALRHPADKQEIGYG
jgi:hypothetical protein